jgi:type IV secretion system protein VirB5
MSTSTPTTPPFETTSPFAVKQGRAPQENPYISGRREWNERYGDYIASMKSWRAACFGALGVAALAVAGVAYIGAQNRVVPYIVEINKLGDPLGIYPAEVMQKADTRILKAQLGRFVVAWRTVSPDLSVVRRNINELYAMLSSTDPATITMNDWMKEHSPFERAQTETISVELNNLLPISGETWQVEWTETRRSRHGDTLDVKRWRCSPTIAFKQPKDEAEIMRNPIGLYIKEISFSQQLTNTSK